MKLRTHYAPVACIVIGAGLFGCTDHRAADDALMAAKESMNINGQVVPIESTRRIDMEQVYEVRLTGGEVLYTDAMGELLIAGRLYQRTSDGLVDLTDLRERQRRVEQLGKFPASSTVYYPASGHMKGEIVVFTDPGCPYCQKLHQDIPQLNEAGISVRYIPYPHDGIQSRSAQQLAQVLCSGVPQEAMSAAFRGETLKWPLSQDCVSGVNQGLQLGQQIGVKGTPTIITSSGEMGQGYMPVHQLIQVAQ